MTTGVPLPGGSAAKRLAMIGSGAGTTTEAVLADGVRRTGVTIHRVTENYDEGPILAQLEVPVASGDDVAALRNRVQAAERELLIRWLANWAAGDGDTGEASAATSRPNPPH
ncbi:formyltransferase family protein [Microlunatus parietis]|uniref:phosphoribosylglycinamide formyltransferase 1 n=1 Tax=Microlunatus parietis TaxID=682979 RepID=A0A7Y9I2A6_9ACTN|nr:formyltransferase family protein [Microlunatus parietis]NYE68921.1 folate-dependent phosphoribosylglycinamide formyltransferase PurN [Microlunatus parietis]